MDLVAAATREADADAMALAEPGDGFSDDDAGIDFSDDLNCSLHDGASQPHTPPVVERDSSLLEEEPFELDADRVAAFVAQHVEEVAAAAAEQDAMRAQVHVGDVMEAVEPRVVVFSPHLFDAPPHAAFLCLVCHNVLDDPMCCTNGHNMCTPCIFSVEERGCPAACGADLATKTPNMALRELIDELPMRCGCGWRGPLAHFRKHGLRCGASQRCELCEWVGADLALHACTRALCKACLHVTDKDALPAHVATCTAVLVPCEHCRRPLPRRALPTHVAGCDQRKAECPACHEEVALKDAGLHKAQCWAAHAPCRVCGAVMPRLHLSPHLVTCLRMPKIVGCVDELGPCGARAMATVPDKFTGLSMYDTPLDVVRAVPWRALTSLTRVEFSFCGIPYGPAPPTRRTDLDGDAIVAALAACTAMRRLDLRSLGVQSVDALCGTLRAMSGLAKLFVDIGVADVPAVAAAAPGLRTFGMSGTCNVDVLRTAWPQLRKLSIWGMQHFQGYGMRDVDEPPPEWPTLTQVAISLAREDNLDQLDLLEWLAGLQLKKCRLAGALRITADAMLYLRTIVHALAGREECSLELVAGGIEWCGKCKRTAVSAWNDLLVPVRAKSFTFSGVWLRARPMPLHTRFLCLGGTLGAECAPLDLRAFDPRGLESLEVAAGFHGVAPVIAANPGLQQVVLGDLTPECVAALAACPKLKSLTIASGTLTDDTLYQLGACRSLHLLTIRPRVQGMTLAGVQALIRQLPHLCLIMAPGLDTRALAEWAAVEAPGLFVRLSCQ